MRTQECRKCGLLASTTQGAGFVCRFGGDCALFHDAATEAELRALRDDKGQSAAQAPRGLPAWLLSEHPLPWHVRHCAPDLRAPSMIFDANRKPVGGTWEPRWADFIASVVASHPADVEAIVAQLFDNASRCPSCQIEVVSESQFRSALAAHTPAANAAEPSSSAADVERECIEEFWGEAHILARTLSEDDQEQAEAGIRAALSKYRSLHPGTQAGKGET